MPPISRIGILTGGGDAPGLNAVIRAVVKSACNAGIECLGIEDSFDGLLEPDRSRPLTPRDVRGIMRLGGTILGTLNTGNPFSSSVETSEGTRSYSERCVEMFHKMGLGALVTIGGDGTLAIAHQFSERGIPLVGVPKTIDRDLAGTDYTLGFDTALRNITQILERSRTPAGSHGWVQIVEVMGRHAGHLALWSGVAGQAHIILIPELPFRYNRIFHLLRDRMGEPGLIEGKPRYAVVVVAEGARAEDGDTITLDDRQDAFGHARLGGIGDVLATRIANETPYESRAVLLGHPQRGGPPSAIDRIMGLLFGARAAEAVAAGDFGKLVSARGIAPACELSLVDISAVSGKIQTVDVARHYDTERYHLKGIGM